MKQKLFFLILLIPIQLSFAADTCVSVLTKNNIPRSRAVKDCQKKIILYREQSGTREVVKDVPIYGASKPDWMMRETYDRLRRGCYNNSKEAYEAACAAGYSIGKNGECRLPTYQNGEQIRNSTTPTYSSAEECYKKKGIYAQRGSRKEKTIVPVFENVSDGIISFCDSFVSIVVHEYKNMKIKRKYL